MLKVRAREVTLNDTATTPTPQALEALQRELADRRSIVHLAHAGVATVTAFIFGGAAAKLFWDSIRLPYLGVAAAGVALLCLLYAWVNYRRGNRLLTDERQRFEAMMEMRQALHLDDPAALLPQ